MTLPKGDLERDGLVDENGEVEPSQVAVDRVGEGEYKIQVLDPDE